MSIAQYSFVFFFSDFLVARQNIIEPYHRDSATGANGKPTYDTANNIGVITHTWRYAHVHTLYTMCEKPCHCDVGSKKYGLTHTL